ncbi:MAG: HD domain-containing protein [Gammaproteobacteria bacterium]|nr:HD domain-containing protein [Gammaproteobacteria bacterium]
MFDYQDTLHELNKNIPVGDKLLYVHNVLKQRYEYIDRIAIAVYDPKTDLLKTFLHSSGQDEPLNHYQASLADSPSLQEILQKNKPRVVSNLNIFKKGKHTHTQKIQQQGYASSYTMPMFIDNTFFGFLFFNSYHADAFNEESLHYLDIFGHLITMVVGHDLTSMRNLMATVKTAKDMAKRRDFETGAHLNRMAHYSRLIALKLADKYNFTDEYIEKVFVYAPLHDIGKIGIPDNILLKPGKLSDNEFEQMKTHTSIGKDMIDNILCNFDLENFTSTEILRNIAELHHEAVNGSGYPLGLKGSEIPIESRIVAVADVFDALTSKRPYKMAWDNQEAFAMLEKLAGEKLDGDCVSALISCQDEIKSIQERFSNNHSD